MIEQQMQLDRSLGLPKLRPIEQRRTELDHRRVQGVELVAEAEPLASLRHLLAAPQDLLEDRLEQLPGTMLVGIGQGRTTRRPLQAQMLELAQAAAQPPTDLPQRARQGQLAEQHGHELVPAGEALGIALRARPLDRLLELESRE